MCLSSSRSTAPAAAPSNPGSYRRGLAGASASVAAITSSSRRSTTSRWPSNMASAAASPIGCDAIMASILLEHVSVIFAIYGASSRSLKSRIISAGTGGRIGMDARNHIVVQALDDVSMAFEHGDRIALIGHNGAGKTTLLRVLSGIFEPVSGRVVVDGKVASLFDATLGM